MKQLPWAVVFSCVDATSPNSPSLKDMGWDHDEFFDILQNKVTHDGYGADSHQRRLDRESIVAFAYDEENYDAHGCFCLVPNGCDALGLTFTLPAEHIGWLLRDR